MYGQARFPLLVTRLWLTLSLVAEDEAPSGMMARGHYDAISKFVDDDDHTHLKFEWSFDITKEWR
jgi:hypothetical protein